MVYINMYILCTPRENTEIPIYTQRKTNNSLRLLEHLEVHGSHIAEAWLGES